VVQPKPAGFCDAIFRAVPLIRAGETVAIGLPDTVWFPEDGLCSLPDHALGFLLFPVERPEFFDAVVTEEDDSGRIRQIQVKQRNAQSNWIWSAFKMPGSTFLDLHRLWLNRKKQDEYFGPLINAYIAEGGEAFGIRAGESYVDVGTLHGYREAIRLLSEKPNFAEYGRSRA
jgi:glucose-1-phosphate thymidylyltransferase